MVYGDQIVKDALFYSSAGLTQKQMALLWHVTEKQVCEWKNVHPEFAEALERGEAVLLKNAFIPINDGIDPKVITDPQQRFENGMRITKIRNRSVWGDVNRTELTGKDGEKLFDGLTDEELIAKAAEVISATKGDTPESDKNVDTATEAKDSD